MKSDGPDGLIGFSVMELERIIANPEISRDIEFTIELSGGIDEFLTGADVSFIHARLLVLNEKVYSCYHS